MMKPRFLVLTGVVFLAALFRVLPHPYNFTPIAGMALFGGAHFSNKKLAFLVPLIAMILSDVVIGWHNQVLIVYACFMAIVGVGLWLRERRSAVPVLTAALGSSVFFFLVTNFFVWILDGLYPMTVQGLVDCYAMAIPFLHNTIFGDLFYTTVFFGTFAVVENRFLVLREQPVPAVLK